MNRGLSKPFAAGHCWALGLCPELGPLFAYGPAAVSLVVAATIYKLSGGQARYAAALPLAAALAFAVLANSTAAVLLRRQVVWKGRRFTAGEPNPVDCTGRS